MKTRSYQKELLDSDNIPFGDIQLNMQGLDTLNTYLGGHAATCSGIRSLLSSSLSTLPVSIAEIGCGGGDNLFSIRRYLDKRMLTATLIGIDIKSECIAYARQRFGTDIEWICSDYRCLSWQKNKPDIIFSSLFCHHFTDEELIDQLRWLKENSRIGFFINDLHRHPLAYHSIRLITRFFFSSYLIRNDAPLSVRRGFRKNEWIRILSSAGITDYTIKWRWAFRHLICVTHEQ